MYINLGNFETRMILVFQLTDALKHDPGRVAITQALTLDWTRPSMGLKGNFGLFGSPEWWMNIEKGRIPLSTISGVVVDAFEAGMDHSGTNNTVTLRLDDGSLRHIGIYVNDEDDIRLFRKGCLACIVFAFDELKQQPAKDGSVNYAHIALEMAVSVAPTE